MSEAVELLDPEQLSEVVSRWQSQDRRFAGTLRTGIHPARALSRLGVRLCLEERYPESLAVLRAAVTVAPEDPLLWNNLAVVLERAELLSDAAYSLERSLALDPRQADAWLLLANMKKNAGDLSAAQAAYDAALRLEPDNLLAWQNLGLLKQEQRQFHDAIGCFLRCANAGHLTAPILSILGQLFYQTGQFEKSLHAYAAAGDLDPHNALYAKMRRRLRFLHDVLARENIDAAIASYQQSLPPDADAEESELSSLLASTFSLLSGYGHVAAAERVGQKRLELAPGSPTAAYLLQALAGDASVSRSPNAYLVEHFDAFAAGFDQHLTATLGYDIPRKLCEAVARFLPSRKIDVLDVGCGTGLCGPHIRPFAGALTGIDLSPKMLERARARGLYDRLICDEITACLAAAPAAADLLLAADVLIYFGDLVPLFAAIARALRPGGHLALSIELSAKPTYELLPSGRFAHNPAYLRAAAHPHFTEKFTQDTPLRLEAAAPVPGALLIFQR